MIWLKCVHDLKKKESETREQIEPRQSSGGFEVKLDDALCACVRACLLAAAVLQSLLSSSVLLGILLLREVGGESDEAADEERADPSSG